MLTHNTHTSGHLVPVVMENPDGYTFAPGEREEWHDTTDSEYAAYLAYWDARA